MLVKELGSLFEEPGELSSFGVAWNVWSMELLDVEARPAYLTRSVGLGLLGYFRALASIGG